MASSNVTIGPTRRDAVMTDEPDGQARPGANQRLFAGLLALLLATGWAANHFAGLIPAMSERQHLSRSTLDAVFGVYALGLLPGLLIGGRTSDAVGRRPVAWVGSIVNLAGTLAMLMSQRPDVLLVGRLVVGLGVGLVISSCTAWASDLKGPAGAAVAGAVLTAGFAVGPFAAGAIASMGASGVWVSFLVAAVIVIAAAAVTVLAARRVATDAPITPSGPQPESAADQGVARALSWAIPLAPWAFASATLAFVTIPTHMHTPLAAPLAAGTAALITNGVSGIIQLVARARRWGPQAGTTGAVLAALGYAATAAAPQPIPLGVGVSLMVVLGCASGLVLREGLIDLEAAAPQHLRGALTGAFYTVSYIGFGLPMLLSSLGSAHASMIILGVMAALAAATAVGRAARLRRDSHRQN
ncbi:MFS transporter [Mycobacterium numidiamassiliense]|uniref:MFS transporter n=1 Tax=Mycobacterium numidiamassiliense TaxID=1841861 RepID=UPI0026C8D862